VRYLDGVFEGSGECILSSDLVLSIIEAACGEDSVVPAMLRLRARRVASWTILSYPPPGRSTRLYLLTAEGLVFLGVCMTIDTLFQIERGAHALGIAMQLVDQDQAKVMGIEEGAP
jgi:hypothetical protein